VFSRRDKNQQKQRDPEPAVSPNRNKIQALQKRMQTLTTDLLDVKHRKQNKYTQQLHELEMAMKEHVNLSEGIFEAVNEKAADISDL
jgi:hypothetical protein